MLHLVESDAEKLNGLSRYCFSSGFKLLAFDSSLLYLEFAKSPEFSPPDALLAAYHMPLMDGAELAAEVRKLHPQQKIVLTSDFPEPDIASRADLSICSYLHQPNYFAKLATLLRLLHKCDRAPAEVSIDTLASTCQFRRNPCCPHHSYE